MNQFIIILSFMLLQLSIPSLAGNDPIDKAAVAALAKQSLSCIYSQTPFEDRKDCLFIRKLFIPKAFSQLTDYINSDENFQIAKEYSMVMSEYQEKSTIDQISAQTNSGAVTLRITTPFTLYLVKDNIEIVSPMVNTIVLSYPENNPSSWSVESLTSVATSEPKIIDHKKIRQVNCSV